MPVKRNLLPYIAAACVKLIIALIIRVSSVEAADVTQIDPFPYAQPESVGISQDVVDSLTSEIQSMVDSEQLVGAELVIIKDRRTILRKAFGWKDREAGEPMQIDAVYCVRSMTKPLVGTAVQMLIDEGRLSLETLVQDILPAFATPQTETITIEHLLTHTSGLPFTTFRRALSDYADLAEVAAEAAATELLFEPGTGFQYSDAGSDTLGAIVTQVSGIPAEQFIQQRILKPLNMHDSVTLLGENESVKARIPSAYSGGTASWSKHWEPSDPPIFPLFLTSQSLYSTTVDYAKFLSLWMDEGQANNSQLLSQQAVKRALTAANKMGEYPNAMDGLDTYYGQQWLLYSSDDETELSEPVMFGHDGSDGTHAWVWPEQDLMVLFFTQSRGTLAGIGLQQSLQQLVSGPADVSATADLQGDNPVEQVAGIYWDQSVSHAYYVVTPHNNGLILRRPGKMQIIFKPGDQPDQYVHESGAQASIEFERADDGSVKGMHTFFGEEVEYDPRHVPVEGLPSAEQVVAMVQQAHGIDNLASLGVVQMRGTMDFIDRKISGSINTLFDLQRTRTDVQIASSEQTIVINADKGWSEASATGVDLLSGRILQQELLGQTRVLYGNWMDYYDHVEVLKRVHFREASLIMLRVATEQGIESAMFVDEESGLLIRKDDLLQVPGMGIVGTQSLFEDYRDVGGMKLSFDNITRYASQFIGRVVMKVEEAATGVEVADDTFLMPSG